MECKTEGCNNPVNPALSANLGHLPDGPFCGTCCITALQNEERASYFDDDKREPVGDIYRPLCRDGKPHHFNMVHTSTIVTRYRCMRCGYRTEVWR
ncbi:MAG: hypothetical protein AAF581_11175 [Planctomycetota bacterium]